MPRGEGDRSPSARLYPLDASMLSASLGGLYSCKPQHCTWEGTGHPTGAAVIETSLASSEVRALPTNICCQTTTLRSES